MIVGVIVGVVVGMVLGMVVGMIVGMFVGVITATAGRRRPVDALVRPQPLAAARRTPAVVPTTAPSVFTFASVAVLPSTDLSAAISGRALGIALHHDIHPMGNDTKFVVLLAVLGPNTQLDAAPDPDQIALPQAHRPFGHGSETVQFNTIGLGWVLSVDVELDDDSIAVARTKRAIRNPTSKHHNVHDNLVSPRRNSRLVTKQILARLRCNRATTRRTTDRTRPEVADACAECVVVPALCGTATGQYSTLWG